MWIFKHKKKYNVCFEHYKACLIGDDRSQILGVDCGETFNPWWNLWPFTRFLPLLYPNLRPFISWVFIMLFSMVIYMGLYICTNHLVSMIRFTVIMLLAWGNLFMVWSKRLVPSTNTLLTMFLPLGSSIVFQITISSPTNKVLTWHTSFFMLMTSLSSHHLMIFRNLSWHSLYLNLLRKILVLSYFLEITMTRHVGGLFLSQSTYACEIIAHVGIESCKPFATLGDTKQKYIL